MKCLSIPNLGYGSFSRFIHKDAAKKRIPISGGLELTFHCNLKCVHCYALSGIKDDSNEYSFQEVCAILDAIANEGCLWLLITGGEPLVRKDFLDIYVYAKKKGFIITLFTNGTLMNEDIIRCFQRWHPFNIEITLYGAKQETYESISGVSGSYKKCLNGIDLLLNAKLPLRLKSIIMSLNKHEIEELRQFSNSHGMSFLFDPVLSFGLNGSDHPKNYRLTPEEIVELDMSDKERFQSWKEYLDDFGGQPLSDNLYLCGAGETSFFINPYGELQMCVLSRFPSYNLRTGNFREGWYNFIGNIRKKKVRKNFRCRKCDLLSFCGQCPGWSNLEHNNLNMPVDYLCSIAHLRAMAIHRSIKLGKEGCKE